MLYLILIDERLMMRTSFLLSLMYMVIVGVSHSQTMKVVWEKQLAANEKFLSVSRDGKLLLTYQAPILRLSDAQTKQEIFIRVKRSI